MYSHLGPISYCQNFWIKENKSNLEEELCTICSHFWEILENLMPIHDLNALQTPPPLHWINGHTLSYIWMIMIKIEIYLEFQCTHLLAYEATNIQARLALNSSGFLSGFFPCPLHIYVSSTLFLFVCTVCHLALPHWILASFLRSFLLASLFISHSSPSSAT